ncbi:uncharacterized protein LOC135832586 isoform X2 [Planococcus citri]|uniref:uncharacterized protein LOC135832586 isoform X2 n=1 Tax=Planococcus citri TaxID=170843 RepID=UPI0031FA3D42
MNLVKLYGVNLYKNGFGTTLSSRIINTEVRLLDKSYEILRVTRPDTGYRYGVLQNEERFTRSNKYTEKDAPLFSGVGDFLKILVNSNSILHAGSSSLMFHSLNSFSPFSTARRFRADSKQCVNYFTYRLYCTKPTDTEANTENEPNTAKNGMHDDVINGVECNTQVEYFECSARVKIPSWERSHAAALVHIGKLQSHLDTALLLRYQCTARAELDRLETKYGLGVRLNWKKIDILKDPVDKAKEIRVQRWLHIGNVKEIQKNEEFYSKLLNQKYTVEQIATIMAEAYHQLSVSIKTIALGGRVNKFKNYHLTEDLNVNKVLDILIEKYDFKHGTFE